MVKPLIEALVWSVVGAVVGLFLFVGAVTLLLFLAHLARLGELV